MTFHGILYQIGGGTTLRQAWPSIPNCLAWAKHLDTDKLTHPLDNPGDRHER